MKRLVFDAKGQKKDRIKMITTKRMIVFACFTSNHFPISNLKRLGSSASNVRDAHMELALRENNTSVITVYQIGF